MPAEAGWRRRPGHLASVPARNRWVPRFPPADDIVCHMAPLYKLRRAGPVPGPCTDKWIGLGKVEELSTLRKRAFHERSPARLFPRQAAGLEGRDFTRIEEYSADPAGRKRQSPRSRRSGIFGN